MREHLEAAARHGRRDPRLDAVNIPKGVEYIWLHFWQLHSGTALTYSEIMAYGDLTGWKPRPHEVEMVKSMDGEYQAFVAERIKKGADNA